MDLHHPDRLHDGRMIFRQLQQKKEYITKVENHNKLIEKQFEQLALLGENRLFSQSKKQPLSDKKTTLWAT